jgi:hypothetical protein
MWVEYGGLIYDTMPGYDLHATLANSETRNCPFLETEQFSTAKGHGVAFCVVRATEAQLENMKSATLHKSANIAEDKKEEKKE